MQFRLLTLATVAMATLGLAACTDSGVESPVGPEAVESRFDNNGNRPSAPNPSIADVVVAAAEADEPEFTILLAALQETGLTGPLSGKGQFTVFAPTDAAFGRLAEILGFSSTEELVTYLVSNPDFLEDVLLYHVAPGRRLSGDVLESEEIPTLEGDKVFPVITEAGPAIRDTNAATPDALLQLEDGLDIEASNGVIHIIDQVLLFGEEEPGDDEDEGDDDGDDDDGDDVERDARTIAQFVSDLATAEEGADFTYLLAALDAAGLVDALNGKRQFTVFAPNDAAFEAAAAGLGFVDGDDNPDVGGLVTYLVDNELLAPVLLYHVAPGRRDAEDVLESEEINTLQGAFLFPALQDGTPFLVDASDLTADSEILATDFQLANGIVHVISDVLLPVNGADLP